MNGTVVVDTNVLTARLRKDRSLETKYAKHTVGRRVAVAPQTIAEARYGAVKAGWGQRRLKELSEMIERVRMVPDLWMAAVAVRWALPLVAHDAVFIGCPRLDLRSELAV